MLRLLFILIMGIIVISNAEASINTATLQGFTVQGTDVVAGTNSLLLEDGSYLLHENSDTMQLEA